MNWAKKRLFLIYALFALLVVAGCGNEASVDPSKISDNENTEQVETKFDGRDELLEEAANLFSNEQQVITPTEVYEKVVLEKDPNYLIVDVRDNGAFGLGNIDGSINIPYAQTANLDQLEQLPKDKKLIVVCFSGHTASQTAALWSLLGYDAIPMLNGMGGWSSDADLGAPIPSQPFNLPTDNKTVEKGSFNLPEMLGEDAENLPSLLSAASKEFLAKELPPVKPPKVIYEEVVTGDSDDAMIVDIRSSEDYEKGHIKGAINIPYEQLMSEESLISLNPNKEIILIDYNGHIASKAARVLGILGYDSYVVKDGMRAWTSDEKVNGIPPISTEKIYDYPTSEINVDLDSEAGPASCS